MHTIVPMAAPDAQWRASKTSRSVLATIDEGASQLTQRASGARGGPPALPAPPTLSPLTLPMPPSGWPTPITPRRTSQPVPHDVDANGSSDEESQAGDGNFAYRDLEQLVAQGACARRRYANQPVSPVSLRSTESAQIVYAHRIQRARARSHAMSEIKKSLDASHVSRRPGPRSIAKDLRFHLENDLRTARSASLPSAHQRSESTPSVSLRPPPRPRNKALIRPSYTPPARSSPRIQSASQPQSRPLPALVLPSAPSRRESLVYLDNSHSSLHSLPLSPIDTLAPPSTLATTFPQSPHSTIFHSCSGSVPSTPYSSFLPSCEPSTPEFDSYLSTAQDTRDDQFDNSSALNLFGDFSFLHSSALSLASNVSGYSARDPNQHESIPTGLHCPGQQGHQERLPISPRSSLPDIGLESRLEVDVLLPLDTDEDDDDESITEEDPKKSILLSRARAKSLSLSHLSISSRNKVDRVLGKGAAHALISGVHVHVPHLSMSSMASEPPFQSSDYSSPPSATPSGASLMVNLGRKISKKSPSAERRRSDDVQRLSPGGHGLMARVDRLIGRTPSPSGLSRDVDSDDDSPASAPILNLPKPPTINSRTPAERAEMLKKTRKIQQLMGDVPPTSGAAAAFYRMSRAARSEDSLPTPTFGRADGFAVSGASDDAKGALNQGRGFHRSTASLSSKPRLVLAPVGGPIEFHVSEDFGLGLVSPTKTDPDPIPVPEAEEPRDSGPDNTGTPGLDEPDKAAMEEERMTDDEGMVSRRARRAKVAKLYRYLGSRVPPHLVFGLDDAWDYEQGLPGVRSEDEDTGASIDLGRKKRHASDGDCTPVDDQMADLSVMSSEEKARAVRRKAKMEKMFGEHPPQRLYQLNTGTDSPAISEGGEGRGLDNVNGGAHYQSYRASFNSLAYFVNNADRDSLEGLYDIVSGPGDGEGSDEEQKTKFTARRKRAAKLSNFFGVSYRDLFGAVLDILESDVKEDKEEGSLSAAETQDLLIKLRRLKAKGEGIHV